MTFQTPNNKIVIQGFAHANEANAAVATLKPGYLATKGTTDDDAILNTAATLPTGWVGYESAAPAFKPANLTTAYAVGDRVPIVSCKGSVVLATLATSQTAVRGSPLISAAGGLVQVSTIAAAITAGVRIVAYAEQSVTTTASTATILARSEI